MVTSAVNDPLLSVQVDVDTERDLLGFYGIEHVEEDKENIVYTRALPRFAELFADLDIRATFFVVGRDLVCGASRAVVRALSSAGHEIGNHTQTHPFGFSAMDAQEKRRQIQDAGTIIETVTGDRPAGFRAPGYDVDRGVLETLVALEYLYDSSVMPSAFNVPFKVVSMLLGNRSALAGYGTLGLGVAPTTPYYPDFKSLYRARSKGPLLEIPVSCVPYCRLPFYANFNLFSGNMLFDICLRLLAGRHVNYVFHAVEMLDPSEIDRRLHRHPNARLPVNEKRASCREFLRKLRQGRRIRLSKQIARDWQERARDSTSL